MIALYIRAYSGHLALRAKYKLDPGLGRCTSRLTGHRSLK